MFDLDEAYLDVTENAWGETFATPVARRLKQQIKETTGLTASAGVAPNKFLAKIASGWRKPDGLTVVPRERVEAFLQQLPVDRLWGVGPVTARRLRAAGVEQLVDVRGVELEQLQRVVGSQADRLRQLAHGVDDRPVTPERAAKSRSAERTYAEDLRDIDTVRAEVDRLARRAAAMIERADLYARTVTVKVRYHDFKTITRSHTDRAATRDADSIARRACALLDRTDAGHRPVRLLGVGLHGLAQAPGPAAPGRERLLWESEPAQATGP